MYWMAEPPVRQPQQGVRSVNLQFHGFGYNTFVVWIGFQPSGHICLETMTLTMFSSSDRTSLMSSNWCRAKTVLSLQCVFTGYQLRDGLGFWDRTAVEECQNEGSQTASSWRCRWQLSPQNSSAAPRRRPGTTSVILADGQGPGRFLKSF